ncbi:MAG TPA: hypothetical protein VFU43_11455 [Streptosporangiaceae bacterium]|nr:hypothetical protein [Streptosporangiaceae bacterium]
MEGSHRSHRRRKKRSAGKLSLAGAATGVVGVMLVALVIVLLRSTGGGGANANVPDTDGAPAVNGGSVGRVQPPRTGRALHLTTPDGFAYDVAAVRGGTGDRPLRTDTTPPPAGKTYAFIDYVLTNTQGEASLLDFPGDLFVRRALVPANIRTRCMPQPGVRGDLCTLPNHSAVIGYLGRSKAPVEENGDQYMPPGASYLVRVATTQPVDKGAAQRDLRLYVWDARYISDRRAVEVAFP